VRVFGGLPPGVTAKPRRAAYAVIVDATGRVAAVRARPGERGAYWLPGGAIEAGESPEDAVRREVREELGRGVHVGTALGEATQIFDAGDEGWYEMHATFLRASFEDTPPGRGEQELHWLEPRDVVEAFYHPCHAWAVDQEMEDR
jgi:8-oxo-dGTP diphosphatase